MDALYRADLIAFGTITDSFGDCLGFREASFYAGVLAIRAQERGWSGSFTITIQKTSRA